MSFFDPSVCYSFFVKPRELILRTLFKDFNRITPQAILKNYLLMSICPGPVSTLYLCLFNIKDFFKKGTAELEISY